MARILITGAGMVGCHAASELVGRGHEVALFDVAPRMDYVTAVAGERVTVTRGDVRELPVLLAAVRSFGADVVVHTAALIGGAAQAEPFRGLEVNVVGTINVAEAVRLADVGRLVHASTLGVNDLSQPQLGPLTEEFPRGSGGRIYGASKVAAEEILRATASAYGFELAMLRFAGIYGYGHFAGGSGIGREVDGWVRAALRGEPGRLTGGMPDVYEIVHAKDVGRAIAAACTVERLAHDTYNVGTGILVTPSDVVDALGRLVPGFRIEGEPAARPDPFPRHYPFDLSRSRHELGYEPAFGLELGLADLVARIRLEAAEVSGRG